MNKREFYKELMSEYSFDKQKILCNAKKGKRAGRNPLPIYIGMTAAAAAIVVTAGTAVFTAMNRSNGANYIQTNDAPLAALNDEERINRAMDEIRENEDSSELYDVLVTFSRPLSPAEAQSLLTSYSDGSIPVKMLYMSDNTHIEGQQRIGEVFDGGTELISGAVINCAGYIMQQLRENESVLLVEIVTGDDMGMIAPIKADAGNENHTESVGIPITNYGTSNFDEGYNDSDTTVSDNSPVLDNAEFDSPEPITSDPTSSSLNGSIPSVTVPENNSSAAPEISETSETSTGESESIAETSVDNPVTVSLPQSVPAEEYTSGYIGAESAYFLNGNTFFVKTSQSVMLYNWDGDKETLIAEQTVEEPQVFWINENGSQLMITGKENGVRCKVFELDANGAVYDLETEDIIQGNIVSAAYSAASNMLVLNVYNNERYNVVTSHIYDYTASDDTVVFEDGIGTSVIAEYNGILYFSETANGKTSIYKTVGGETEEAAVFDGVCSVNTNYAFTHAVINGDFGRAVFDPETGSMILLRSGDPVEFGVSRHTLSYGGTYYNISGGELVPLEFNLDTAAKIDYRRSFSAEYCAEAVDGAVRIIPSVYNSRNLNESLFFGQPVENCSENHRAAVNTAIGIQNALSGGRCAECGITGNKMLSNIISEGFSETAAAELKTRCGVYESEELSYNGGGLSAINTSGCVLVMQDDFNGTLYIKAGTFAGNTAYITRKVRFVNENGSLKADNIIEF